MEEKISKQILKALQDLAIPEKAAFLPKFFKTGEGEYGEGDLFLGVIVPEQRKVAKEFWDKISLQEVKNVISSPYHEMRLTAIFILVTKFEKTKNKEEQKKIIDFYLNNTQCINNWDLVDSSCYKILGRYCFENQQENILRELSYSEDMWEKRIAVVGTMHYVKKGHFDLTKELVINNLRHPHDLMHKANGWLLREIGGKDEKVLLAFLEKHYKEMPRTTLRYAIEKLEEEVRQNFLKGKV